MFISFLHYAIFYPLLCVEQQEMRAQSPCLGRFLTPGTPSMLAPSEGMGPPLWTAVGAGEVLLAGSDHIRFLGAGNWGV